MIVQDRCSLTPDKFGYYQVGDVKTYSKLEALELQKTLGLFPQWKFNEAVYTACDWTQEPESTLWNLYRQRARQIRNTYDYVVILYSGGSDSQNLLGAWIDEGLKIDEIATQWNIGATKSRDAYWNGEVDRVVFPMLEEIKKRGIEFRFRLLDVSQDTQDIVDFHGFDYQYYANTNLSPNNHAKNLWRHRIADYKNIIDSGKKLCFVWGSDKPFLHWDGRYYCVFQDIIDNCVNAYTQLNYNLGWYDELFYWTPDLPEIAIKQAHVLKRFCETNMDAVNYQTEFSRFGYNRQLKKYLQEETVKLLLYPHWKASTYVDGKPGINIVSWRDTWLINSTQEQGLRFQSYLHSLKQRLDSYWLNDVTTITKGLKGCISPHYYLEN